MTKQDNGGVGNYKEKNETMDKMNKGGLIDAPKIYVADLEAYNNGKLVGEWLDLSDFEDGKDVSKEISKLLKKWGAEEYAIHDVENVPSSMYSEYMGEEDFDKIIKIYKASEESDLPYEVISEIILQYEPEDLEEWISDHYEGHFDNDTDLAYSVVENMGSVSDLGEKTTEMYFDYEGFGRDLAINDEWEGDFDSDEDRGYDYVENMGGVSELGDKTIDMYFDYEKFGRDLAIDDYTEIEDGYYFRTPRYAKGGLTNERRYVNKDEDYETRYAKDKPMRKGYKAERKFAVGGEVGNKVSFKGDYGTPRSGIVKEKRGSSYIVATDDGDRLVDSYEVISFSEAPMEKKKRFGFFENGGGVEGVEVGQVYLNTTNNSYIIIYKVEDSKEAYPSVYYHTYNQPQSYRNSNIDTISKFEDFVEDGVFVLQPDKMEKGGGVHTMPDGKVMLNSAHYEGGGEIQSKIDKLNKVVNSKMLPESAKAKARTEIEKLEKQLHESKETKAEEKEEHKGARLDEKEELNATIQKLYGIESKAEDLINYQDGGIQSQSVDKIKKYVEYINKEVSKLNVPFGSEVYEVLQDENAHSLNLTLGLLGFYKNEKDSGEWAKKHEQYTKLVDVVNEIKGGGKPKAKEPKFKIGDVVGLDLDERTPKMITSFKTNRKGEIIYSGYYIPFPNEKWNYEESEIVLLKTPSKSEAKKPTTRKAPVKAKEKILGIEYTVGTKGHAKALAEKKHLDDLNKSETSKIEPKPKADHKKLLAKIKAKKGDKEYDNKASLNPETGERRKRSESSDKKREALPLGKRVSASGNKYYENRLNRGDISKEDKFEEGGEVKSSGWGLKFLKW